jgi:uncharacterized protein YdeI (YjbR/CyaY-like superfamily)
MKTPEHPLIFHHQLAWREWLAEHHASHKDAWLVIRKRHTAGPGIFLDEAVEEALCFGWIDGLAKSAEVDFYFLRFSPRKVGSEWAISNQLRVERLIAEGRMTEAGLVKVREAQESGEWQAAIQREDTENLPDDLRQALEADSLAQAGFERLPASQKKQYLYWIASARTVQTRQKRIRQTVENVARDKRLI